MTDYDPPADYVDSNKLIEQQRHHVARGRHHLVHPEAMEPGFSPQPRHRPEWADIDHSEPRQSEPYYQTRSMHQTEQLGLGHASRQLDPYYDPAPRHIADRHPEPRHQPEHADPGPEHAYPGRSVDRSPRSSIPEPRHQPEHADLGHSADRGQRSHIPEPRHQPEHVYPGRSADWRPYHQDQNIQPGQVYNDRNAGRGQGQHVPPEHMVDAVYQNLAPQQNSHNGRREFAQPPLKEWNWAYDNPSFVPDDRHNHYQNHFEHENKDEHQPSQGLRYRGSDFNENVMNDDVIQSHLPSRQSRHTRRKSRKLSQIVKPDIDVIKKLSAHDQAELYRSNLMRAQVTGGDGYEALKYKGTKAYKSVRGKTREALAQFEIWGGSFKEIEGHFGTGVLQFFRFVKIIFNINVWIAFIMFLCLCIPQLLLQPWTFSESIANMTTETVITPSELVQNASENNDSSLSAAQQSTQDYVALAGSCSVDYVLQVEKDINSTANSINVLVDLLQGTGWMENTILFYGFYYNKTYFNEVEQSQTVFNMPLAFLLCTGAYFLISLIIMMNSMAKGLTESLTSRSDSNVNFCNKVFCGWDYALSNNSIAKLKKKNVKIEFESDLAEEKRKLERMNRTTADKAKLYTLRIFINLFVMAVLGGSFYLIYFVTDQQSKLLQETSDEFVILLIQFMPSLTITALYFILPIGFEVLVGFEKYSPEFEIEISLVRIVFVRLASLAVLLGSAYAQIGREKCNTGADKECGNCFEDGIYCWETYVGQQIYKLVVLDFLVHLAVTIVEFVRKAIVQRWFHVKLFDLLGYQEFLLPINVLDIVYTQTLCWVGAFFSPLIPVITLVKVFLIFYLKKWSLMFNQKPSARPYRASSSYLFFLIILLIAFAMTALPVGWAVGKFNPSQTCGPFRIYSQDDYYMFNSVTNTIDTWPEIPKAIFKTIGSAAVYIPLTVLLILLIFYYYAVASGHSKMIKLHVEQLGLEGKDKQFLLARVNKALIRKGK